MSRLEVPLVGAGIDPTGATSSSAAINALLDRCPGARFTAPEDATLSLATPLTLDSMGTMLSLGTATLRPAAGITAISVRSSNNVIEGGTIEGPQKTNYVDGERGIDVVGPSAANPATGLLISGTTVRNFGGYGIRMLHTRGFVLDEVEVTDVYYGGIFGLSVRDGYLRRPVVRRVSANGVLNANAYGIAWSAADESGNLTLSPMSENIITQSPVVSDCTTWHGLDTHGGIGIQFLDIDVRRCHFPVAMNPGDGPGNVATFPPRDFVVTGVIDSERVGNTENRPGLIVAGAWAGGGNVDTSKLATGTIDVTVRGHGGSVTDAGVVLQSTNNLKVTLRTEKCSPASLLLIRDNYGFDIDLTAIDSWSSAATPSFAFRAQASSQGTLRETDSVTGTVVAPSVNMFGVYLDANAGNVVTLAAQTSTAIVPRRALSPATLI